MIVTETVIILRFRIPVYQQIKNNIVFFLQHQQNLAK